MAVFRGAPDEGGLELAALVCLAGAERVEFPAAGSRAAPLLSTEDPPFLGDARPGSLIPSDAGPGRAMVRFTRPGGIVLLVGSA